MTFIKGTKATGGMIVSRNRGSMLFRLAGLRAQAKSLKVSLHTASWLEGFGIKTTEQYCQMQGNYDRLQEVIDAVENLDANMRKLFDVKPKV